MIAIRTIIKKQHFLEEDDVKKIRIFLANNDWNFSTLAIELGVSKQYITELVKGRRNFTNKLNEKLKKLGLDLGV